VENFRFSHSAAYGKINLGTSRAEAATILKDDGIQCFHTGQDRCEFSDYWRGYVIFVHPDSQIVVRKYFGFKKRP
jgi:hypothetical protein